MSVDGGCMMCGGDVMFHTPEDIDNQTMEVMIKCIECGYVSFLIYKLTSVRGEMGEEYAV